ncbi:MAG: NUDIX hydrolase [Pseudomonadota bacterium]
MSARLSAQVLRDTGHDTGKVPVLPQAAALCYRINRGRSEVLLITTRRSGRWIIPKGWPIRGLSAAETAAQEAWEEAGVIGQGGHVKLGEFGYLKRHTEYGPTFCVVEVFSLHVRSILRDFPEKGQRKYKWLSPKKAAQKIVNPDLALILRDFQAFRH